jgi:hypothetical protein
MGVGNFPCGRKMMKIDKALMAQGTVEVTTPVLGMEGKQGLEYRGLTIVSTCREDEGKGLWTDGGSPVLANLFCRVMPPKRPGERFYQGGMLVEVSRVTARKIEGSWHWAITLTAIQGAYLP